ncbi:hypothetical protein HEB94_000536 [Actinopolymorpha pittospori]|uniref:Uncharacterized protein n=1 Tax=Actinopolymorpha pittospori TaxID=648752 RepID=A0A927MRR8_9ACTN|nr:hypothetical protein [Actinopolymorpha pittospori]
MTRYSVSHAAIHLGGILVVPPLAGDAYGRLRFRGLDRVFAPPFARFRMRQSVMTL